MSLQSLWSSAMAMEGSVAVWRCPREDKIHFLADLSESPSKGRIDLQNTEPGFLVSPFMNPEGNETIFLNADVYGVHMSDGTWNMDHGEDAFRQAQCSINYHLNTKPDTEISGEKDHFIKILKSKFIIMEFRF